MGLLRPTTQRTLTIMRFSDTSVNQESHSCAEWRADCPCCVKPDVVVISVGSKLRKTLSQAKTCADLVRRLAEQAKSDTVAAEEMLRHHFVNESAELRAQASALAEVGICLLRLLETR